MGTGNEELKAYLGNEKLKKFLGKNKVICREERQFAALLYSAFLDEKRGRGTAYTKIIVRQCLELEEQEESITIQNVYFEATLMRDFFIAAEKEEKEKFNGQLLQFCLNFSDESFADTANTIEDQLNKERRLHHYFGQKTINDVINKEYPKLSNKEGRIEDKEKIKKIKIRACLDIARMMMNATPDLLVIYKMGDEIYAKALECKYESLEGRYPDVAGVNVKMQYFIQECVMSFLFGTKDDIEKADCHPPKFYVDNSVWEDNEDLREDIYGQKTVGKNHKEDRPGQEWEHKSICYKILSQERESKGIKNKGIAVIRFWEGKEGEQKENSSEIQIDIKKLLENMYIKKIRQ